MAKTKKRKNKMPFVYFTLTLILVVLILNYTNSRVMPSVLKTMEMHGENISLKAVDSAVKEVIVRSGVKTEDLYTKSEGGNGRLTSLSANTMLINSLCSEIAEEILSHLEQLEDETTLLPLGVITGIDFLATKGPPFFSVTVKPLGHCAVNYKTSFKSEGINQVNYQIWLDVSVRIAVVNPALGKDFYVERSLPIVNTYISGEVPDSMFYPFKTE